MTSFSSAPKPAFVYSASDDTWYEISAKTDTTSAYEWGGDHTHLGSLLGFYGINNFLNPTERDNKITTPWRGAICVIRQDTAGRNVNELQIYDGTAWRSPIIDLEIKMIMGAD